MRAFHLAVLHIVECYGAAVAIFPHPQSCEIAYVFRFEKTTQFDTGPGEIDGYTDRDGGEFTRSRCVTF